MADAKTRGQAFPMGARVRIASGSRAGAKGTAAGMSHDGKWVFVVLDGQEHEGPKAVATWGLEVATWRLERLEEDRRG